MSNKQVRWFKQSELVQARDGERASPGKMTKQTTVNREREMSRENIIRRERR